MLGKTLIAVLGAQVVIEKDFIKKHKFISVSLYT